MNFRSIGVALATATWSMSACSGGGAPQVGEAALDTDEQKASYGIGLNMGSQLEPAAERIDRAALMRGIEDALQGNDPVVPRRSSRPS